MTTPHFGFGMPELSPVPGIELAGQQFMQAVFALQPGQTGLAPNQSHTKVYVVRVLGQEPDEETLRQRFLESGYNNFVLMLAQLEARQAAIGWYRGLEDRYQVKWVRPPQEVQRL
jgi:parvulin-like peptidyl-prolyl isomerase